jgi:uncharacterized membrane protein (UPF0127 family)
MKLRLINITAEVVASPGSWETKAFTWLNSERDFNARRFKRQPSQYQDLVAAFSPTAKEEMQRQTYCVYNQTRESFLSLGVAAADTTLTRLNGLIGKLTLGLDEGLWIVPSRGIHTVGVLFPLDLVYLDENHQVLHVVESFPTFRISPLISNAASVLELPTHTIYSSQTQPGDQLLICVAEEMENRLSAAPPGLASQAKKLS